MAKVNYHGFSWLLTPDDGSIYGPKFPAHHRVTISGNNETCFQLAAVLTRILDLHCCMYILYSSTYVHGSTRATSSILE